MGLEDWFSRLRGKSGMSMIPRSFGFGFLLRKTRALIPASPRLWEVLDTAS